jgi:crotonobetainyl-CoA:carnitine CoA-transferase CaiB-like acyl-CoA transferase
MNTASVESARPGVRGESTPRISRRAFVGRTAGAALAASALSDFLAPRRAASETGTVVEVDHPKRGKFLTVGNPIKLSDSPTEVIPSPLLGEHTEEILKTIVGWNDAEIAAARTEGAV